MKIEKFFNKNWNPLEFVRVALDKECRSWDCLSKLTVSNNDDETKDHE